MGITFIEVPFEQRYEARNAGVKYDKSMKSSYVEGPVPSSLKNWASKDYSFERWLEDSVNKHIKKPVLGPVMFTPRPHQVVAQKAIVQSWSNNSPGFLISDSTGLGKTLSIVSGFCSIAKLMHKTPARPAKVLIVCPKGAIPIWRQTLKAYADSAVVRPLVINYQRLNKLIKEPKSSKTAKRARTKNRRTATDGQPKINFDIIVFDESHYLKNYGSSTMSLSAENIAMLDSPYVKGRSPFVIYSTATPGANPMNYAIMAPTLARLIDKNYKKHIPPSKWGPFLSTHGFHVSYSKKWSWISVPWFGMNSKDPKERKKYEIARDKTKTLQDEDTKRIGRAWIAKGSPYISRKPTDLKGWPKQQVEPLYIELDAQGMVAYEEVWSDFRKYLKLRQQGKVDSQSALVQNQRFRQKASILKALPIAEHAVELVQEGKQVFIGCQFLETIDIIKTALQKSKIPCSECSGRTNKEEERLRFQRGETKVVLSSITEAMSFHANETLPDGTQATSAERVTIISDVRQNPNDCLQQMGRAHRDGQNSLCEFPLAIDTIDVKVMNSFINSVRNLENMKGESETNGDPEYLEKIFSEIV
jgi:SNF2 family DNA or RNA helicase